jgi:hypothetical protein
MDEVLDFKHGAVYPNKALRYSPLNTGSRLSKNAVIPSRAS